MLQKNLCRAQMGYKFLNKTIPYLSVSCLVGRVKQSSHECMFSNTLNRMKSRQLKNCINAAPANEPIKAVVALTIDVCLP